MRTSFVKIAPGLLLLLGLWSGFSGTVEAQELGVRRQVRTYIPPDQLVSFLPSTPFDRFLEFLNPIFERVTGKQVIDGESRKYPIGISISGMQFLDALELVLQYNGLRYRETDRYFLVEKAPENDQFLDANAATGRTPGEGVTAGATLAPASLRTREVRISAVLFELNHTVARDTGIDWSVLLGESSNSSAQSSRSGGGSFGGAGSLQQQQTRLRLFLNTKEVFGKSDVIRQPSQVDFGDLNSMFRLAEASGVGETIASPSVSVQSGVEGRIQIGSDVPVQVRDFAGNAVTQFFSTGIIINVTPTVLSEPVADTLDAPRIDIIHLDVEVEKSGSRPSASGPIIDRSTANTQIVLLNGEQTVIGGLYSTDQSYSRTGVPILKDLPGWFFGLRYIFGRTQESETQKELIIALQAEIVEPLLSRSQKPYQQNILQGRRDDVQRAIERFNNDVARKVSDKQNYEESKMKK